MAMAILEQHGLRATLDGADLSTSLSIYGTAVSKCRLMVHPADAEDATRVLKDLGESSNNDWAYSDPKIEWICRECQEPNQMSFDVCWNCQSARTDDAETRPIEDEPTDTYTAIEEVVSHTTDDDNPFAAPTIRSTFIGKKRPLLNHRSKWVRMTIFVAMIPYLLVVVVAIGIHKFFHRNSNRSGR